jgi:hypothetical protein
MRCEICQAEIAEDEVRELRKKKLCEECYIDNMKHVRICDPWATHNARRYGRGGAAAEHLNEIQRKIVHILKERDVVEVEELLESLSLTRADFEREVAPLIHMETVKGELRDKKLYLWIG